jgi:N-acetylmuramoyl-L-alanine amidase
MADVRFEGKRVSPPWFRLLSRARAAGVGFSLTDGRRTMSEQAVLYARYLRNGWPIAAVPNPNAPHIRAGRDNHAVDVNGSQALINFARGLGITLSRTVAGESWHLEVTGGWEKMKQLGAVFKKRGDTLVQGDRGPGVAVLRTLLFYKGFWPFKERGGKAKIGPLTVRQIKAFQRSRNLVADGVVGPKTWAALEKRNPAKRPPAKKPTTPTWKPEVVNAHLSMVNEFGALGTPTELDVHHSAGPRDTDDVHARSLFEQINRQHRSQGWGGIGYHFGVSTRGTLFKLRPVAWKGAHSPPNSGRIGVVLLGNYDNDTPSAAQIRTLRWLYKNGKEQGVPSGLTLKGHKDNNATGCPGSRLYAVLPEIRK